jgi:hypothetical protein
LHRVGFIHVVKFNTFQPGKERIPYFCARIIT